MKKGIEMSKFNEVSSFGNKDINQVADCANKVNTILHKYCIGDMEQYLALVYEVGIMLTSETMRCFSNRAKILPTMLKDVQRDLQERIKLHDKVHKEKAK